MKKPIYTIEDLQEEKRLLALEIRVTERLLTQSVEELPETFQHTLFQKLLLPLGIAGMLGYGARKAMKKSPDSQQISWRKILSTVLPMLVSLGQAYREEKMNTEI